MSRCPAAAIWLLLLTKLACPAEIHNPINFPAPDSTASPRSRTVADANFEFLRLPKYSETCTLQVVLTARSDYPDTLWYPLVAGPRPYLEAPETTLIWPAPIDSGQTLQARVPMRFSGVGEFGFSLVESQRHRKAAAVRVAAVLSERGDLVYLGSAPAPFANPLRAHPYAFGAKLRARVEGKLLPGGQGFIEPFDLKLTAEPTFQVGQRSKVSLEVTAMSDKISDVQFEIGRATNLKIDSLPASWGGARRPGDKFRGHFYITPKAAGRSYLSVEAFGLYPGGKLSQRGGSKLGLYLIFGADGRLLYAGGIDPFQAGYATGNPAYVAIEAIGDQSRTVYGIKAERSLPDYELARSEAARLRDSVRLQLMRDSLKKQ